MPNNNCRAWNERSGVVTDLPVRLDDGVAGGEVLLHGGGDVREDLCKEGLALPR